jgi:succinyl-diaminopimelate desuccinylase
MSLTSVERTLQELVAIRSTTDNRAANRQLFGYVQNRLKRHGMHVVELDDDGYGILLATSRRTKSPKVLLVAHADVVPAPDELFATEVETKALRGRGVWDMKFAIAGYLELVGVLKTAVPDYDFGIAITSDEETRNRNVAYLLRHGYAPKSAVLLDGGQEWQLERAAKGAWTTTVTVSGKTAHGSRPWEGVSASMLLLDLLADVRKLFTSEGPETDTLNISLLSAGTAQNQIPAQAGACLDIRVMNQTSLEFLQDKVAAIYRHYKAQWETTVLLRPAMHDLENAYYRAFIASASAEAKAPERATLSFGASEASSFLEAGIPCIVTRPLGGGHHADTEWVDRKSLNHIVPILQAYLQAVARD